MGLFRKINKEVQIIGFVRKGYTRYTSSKWVNKHLSTKDSKHSNKYEKVAYKNGFLSDSIYHYDLESKKQIETSKFIKDIDCMEMLPLNTSFCKWAGSNVIPGIMFKDYEEIIPKIYMSLVTRDDKIVIIYKMDHNRVLTKEEFIDIVKEQGPFLLRPLFYQNYNRKETFFLDNDFDFSNFNLDAFNEYILIKPFNNQKCSTKQVDVYVASDINELLQFSYREYDEENSEYTEKSFDIKTGRDLDGHVVIEKEVCKKIETYAYSFSERLMLLKFFCIRFDVDRSDVRLDRIITKLTMPKYRFSNKLNDYLIEQSTHKKERINKYKKSYNSAFRRVVRKKIILKFARKGTRFFMQKLWLKALKDDFVNNKDIAFNKKVWAWKRGFLSFRIHQYNLTNDNYKEFLSDYDYAWLNRINGNYQIYVNDKATFRYFLNDYKELLPQYYFLLYRDGNETVVYSMPDYIEGNKKMDIKDVIDLLKEKQILALKRSSGLHGEGFYRLEYKEDCFFINGEVIDEQALSNKMKHLKYHYIVTEYLFMTPELRRIYPDSANTVRMIVVNNSKNEPTIKQCYMRIGSSKSNYTDNVAFGGIVVNVDLEDGRYEEGERLVNHFYVTCKTHPDTKVDIKGHIPDWDGVCSTVLEVARSIPEIEYMGFDVVISDTGLKILEINIYPDLHKVAEFNDNLKSYFNRKIALKKQKYL